MPLLQADAENLSQTDLLRGVITEIVQVDAFFQYIPFARVNGKALVYNREKELGSADFLDPNDTVNESATGTIEVTTRLRVIAGDVDVDKFLEGTDSDTNDQKAVQILSKVKGVSLMFRNAIINGDNSVNSKSFDGMVRLVDPAQTIVPSENGGPLTLALLDELKDLVTITDKPVYVMNRATWRYVKELFRAAGGSRAIDYMQKDFGASVPMIDGIPVLVNDYISRTETCGTATNTTSVYCVHLDEVDGFHGIYGGAATAGLVIEDIGTVQNKDATRTRVKWYVGCALKSTLALARLAGITLD